MYPLTSFLETKKSRSNYNSARCAITQYLAFVYPDEQDRDFEALSIRYLQEEQNHFDYLQGFVRWLEGEGLSPNTVHTRIAHLRYWFSWNDISLTPAQLSNLKTHMPRRVTIHDEGDFTRGDLLSLVSHADVMMRAVLLVLVSSGMRIGECLSIRFNQLQGNEVHLSYQQTKARKPHVYFISQEAMRAVDEWLKVRDVKLSQSRTKTEKCLGHISKAEDDRIFPYSYAVVVVKFNRLQEAAGCYERDPNSGWAKITLHSIRKFTDSTMNIYISKNQANALIGHFEAGDSSYRRYTREQLREAYAKVEPYLTILAPQEYAELKSETQQQLASHDKLLVGLMEDNYQMKQDNKVIKDTLDSLVRYLDSGK